MGLGLGLEKGSTCTTTWSAPSLLYLRKEAVTRLGLGLG